MIKKIISGGQIGAEQAALDIAIELGIPHGGWIQKGRKTQYWSLPEKYQLKEMPTGSHIKRIEQNVVDSEGTVIISHGALTGGADYSRKVTEKHKQPCLHIDLNETPAFLAIPKINNWVIQNKIEVLNVTGSKASEDSDIYNDTLEIIKGAILIGMEKRAPGDHLTNYDKTGYPKKLSFLPKTVGEAVNQIVSYLPLQDRVKMANMKREELVSLNSPLNLFIIDQLLQKGKNRELFRSCIAVHGNEHLDENHAGFVIIEKLWKKLRESHRLRIVK